MRHRLLSTVLFSATLLSLVLVASARSSAQTSGKDGRPDQAVLTPALAAAEWAGEPTPLEGRSMAPDVDAYDRSIERLRSLDSAVVRFGHDRNAWTA